MKAYVSGEHAPYRVEFVLDDIPMARRKDLESSFRQDCQAVEPLIGNFALKSYNPRVAEDLAAIAGLQVIRLDDPEAV